MLDLVVVCPVYNEEMNLEIFNKKLLQVLKNHKNYKLVYVNDGSKDNSLQKLVKLKKNNKKIDIISFTKNFGHQNAINAGLDKFNAKKYLVMDSDGQHDPLLIKKMLKKFKRKIEIIQMVKKNTAYESIIKRFFSRFFYKFFSFLTGVEIAVGSSDFYLISRKVRNTIINSSYSRNFLRGFLHWSGFKKELIAYAPNKRSHGKSSYNFSKQIDFALSGFFNFQSKFFVKIFFFSIFILFLCLIYIMIIFFDYYIDNKFVEGWSTIVVLQLFFGSVVIFFNSFMVYAISRVLNIISKKPNYLIED